MATRAGSQAFVKTYKEANHIAAVGFDFDDQYARLGRYWFLTHWYSNTQYRAIAAFAEKYKSDYGLYRHIRAVRNPFNRLVKLYISKVYGGQINYEDLTKGAIPMRFDNPQLEEPIRQILRWSNWQTRKGLYVGNGAKLGDSFLKVVDDRRRGRVRMEVLDPRKVTHAEFDEVGNVKAITIEYNRRDANGDIFAYKETIDKDRFAFYKNGESHAYFTDANGTPLSEWPNYYGFVPVTLTPHSPTDFDWGEPSIPFGVFRKIDELNDMASVAHDSLRKTVDPLYLFKGASRKKGQRTYSFSDFEKDALKIMFTDASTEFSPITTPVEMSGAVAAMAVMADEIEDELPELGLARLRRTGGDRTKPGITASYNDGIDRINEAQGNYDDGFVRALQMCVTIGSMAGLRGFEPFDQGSYDKGDLEITIGDRPVIKDSVTKERSAELMAQSGAPSWVVGTILDIPDTLIDELKKHDVEVKAEQAAAATRTAWDAAMSTIPEDDEDGEEEDTQAAANSAASEERTQDVGGSEPVTRSLPGN